MTQHTKWSCDACGVWDVHSSALRGFMREIIIEFERSTVGLGATNRNLYRENIKKIIFLIITYFT